jgi:hypothetical protein
MDYMKAFDTVPHRLIDWLIDWCFFQLYSGRESHIGDSWTNWKVYGVEDPVLSWMSSFLCESLTSSKKWWKVILVKSNFRYTTRIGTRTITLCYFYKWLAKFGQIWYILVCRRHQEYNKQERRYRATAKWPK